MSDELYPLHCIEFVEETSFGVDPTGGAYLPVNERPDLSGLKQLVFDDGTVLQDAYQLPKIPGMTARCNGDVSFSTYLYGWSSSLPTAAPASAPALMKMFAAVMGGLMYGGYAATQTDSSTVSIIKLTDASSFIAGQLVATDVGVAPATEYEARFVQALAVTPSPEELALATDMDLSAAPEDSKTVWGSINAYHLLAFPAARKSFTLRFTTHAEEVALLGCRGRSFQIAATNGELAVATFTFAVSGISVDTSPTMSVQSFTDPKIGEFVGGMVRLTDTSTSHDIDCESFTCSYDSGLLPKVDPSNNLGRSEWIKGAGAGMTLEFNPKFQTDFRSWHAAQTALYAELSLGTQPGQMFAIRLPGTFVSDISPQQEVDEQIAQTITLGMNRYTGDTDDATSASDANTIDKYATVAVA